jgi:ABC-type microcin C transport system permease subunit YejE
MAMTGPRGGGKPSRKEGTKGGEILARTLILFRKGIVMTVASTLVSSCGKDVIGAIIGVVAV